ncbi:External NADH dehydrogenase [Ceratobasidium theobromae]|uniref:NADH:ubiquinone reductase (non-electrogenic) n=1 Tax=Ceratobasidium theobromae TaxID=1582974 RepID=A0A5N5QM15_9AGAM|nr:External NADH dehydrogenase [Ceratobasidium theobromae]
MMRIPRAASIARRQVPIARLAFAPPRITHSLILTRPFSTPTSQVPPPNYNSNSESKTQPGPIVIVKPLSRWRSFLQTLGRVTLVSILTATGIFIYVTQKDRYPGEQKPFDSEKKTIVILGSGWGATSMLKSLDTEDYNVVVISPRNYFLFTPLLPSVAIGTLDSRSIIQPTRYITRHKSRRVYVYEAEAQSVDPTNKTVTFVDNSPIKGGISSTTIPYDYLVYAVGAETQTFGIPGVREYSCFMKELHDAEKLRTTIMDCIESAAFKDQSDEEIDRLLHTVVVGGGPTGVELSGELHDFLKEDLENWYPDIAPRLRITLIEALPNVLPTFSRELIKYTESTFKENKIDVLTKTMVKEIKEKSVVVQNAAGERIEIPFGVIVWAAGNVGRPITRKLMEYFPEHQTNKRGITVDDFLRMKGADGIFAVGDCTATSYAPTAQVASQEGTYLARLFGQLAKKERLEARLAELRSPSTPQTEEAAREIESVVKQINKASKLRPFHYSHQGSLAYIGSEKAIADLPFLNGNLASGGVATYLFWRSAYLSNLFSLRNRFLVINDWLKVKIFGRDVSRE